jgi:hypothetical protein
VLAGAAEREHNRPGLAGVGELTTDGWSDSCDLVRSEAVLGPVEDQGELTLEHEVDLLLV